MRSRRTVFVSISLLISIRAPVWGAILVMRVGLTAIVLFQSAHPCGVRLDAKTDVQELQHISIRAPVWGAILMRYTLCQILLISIRAPVWGAIHICQATIKTLERISIRAPVWGAIKNERTHSHGFHFISIRAPVWGAIQVLL